MPRSLVPLLFLFLAACRHPLSPQDVSIAGLVPPLAFTMQDVQTGKPAKAADFRGKTVLLYFGYTNCPDICPTTLYNADRIFHRLGPLASQVVFLFVTVDPDRDTPAALAQYTALFGPNVIGLRGNAEQLFSLARRYRVVFSVTKPTARTPYEVTHSAAVYVFDGEGRARFLIAGLDTARPDISGISADLANVVRGRARLSWFERLTGIISAG